jgi:hypothetical protein
MVMPTVVAAAARTCELCHAAPAGREALSIAAAGEPRCEMAKDIGSFRGESPRPVPGRPPEWNLVSFVRLALPANRTVLR